VETDPVPLAGVHHLKLPVRDLARSAAWYSRTLGYRRSAEFWEGDTLMGIGMDHPAGGPHIALRLDPGRAAAAAGFDYLAIGVPDRAGLNALADRLDSLGEAHGGVHSAMTGWVLPYLHDPDGHEVRLYTVEQHTIPAPGEIMRVDAGATLRRARRHAEQPNPSSAL
jgi:catechol 2,3-dioxygenase-like lactoylglutathione lyase family enzyme